jgi:hypothetical protein
MAMERAETTERTDAADPLNLFWALEFFGRNEREALIRERDALRSQVDALTKLVDLSAVKTLLAENADLHRLLGLRGEVVFFGATDRERVKPTWNSKS